MKKEKFFWAEGCSAIWDKNYRIWPIEDYIAACDPYNKDESSKVSYTPKGNW